MIENFIINKRKIPVTITPIMIGGKQRFDLSFSYNPDLIAEIKESTEKRQWEPERKLWRIQDTPRNRFVMSYLKGENPYAVYDTKLLDLKDIDLIDTIPYLSMDLDSTMILKKFWKHQKQIYQHELLHKRCIVAGETRIGKTLPTFMAIVIILSSSDLEAWWVAPKSALNGLKLELTKWNFPYKINLFTYDKFRSLDDASDNTLAEIVPKVLVFDEAHKLKNPKSIQGSFSRRIAEIQDIKWGENAHRFLLSGTPAPKDPTDWWNLSEICCPGFIRESSKGMLGKRLGEYEQREGKNDQQYWHLIKWKEEEVEYLFKRLSGMVEVFLRKDCLDLPDKLRTLIRLPISEQYARAAKLINKMDIGAPQMQQKLRQVSDGIMYINEIDEVESKSRRVETKFFPSCPKDDQLVNDLEEFEDVGRVIVYCAFQGTIDKLTKLIIREGWAVLKIDGRSWSALNTTYSVEECLLEMDGSHYNSPKSFKDDNINERRIPKLAVLANQGAASTGLEFSASPVIINYSLAFNAADQEQAEGRAYSNNMDKIKGLEIRNYIHLPVDELIFNNLENKKSLQSITLGELSEAIKAIIVDRRN